MPLRLRDIPGVVLAGGLGTRMRSLGSGVPKPMLPVAGRPFLEYVLRYLAAAGVARVVLAVGYRADAVEAHFGRGDALGLNLLYEREAEPLGTGGAIRQACEVAGGWPVLVLNGDSFATLDLNAMLAAHAARRPRITMALAEVADATRFGKVRLSGGGAVVGFEGKGISGPGLVNAGVYLLEAAAVESIPSGPSGFEEAALPRLVKDGVMGFVQRGYFVDIGLPGDYQRLAANPAPLLAAIGLEAR